MKSFEVYKTNQPVVFKKTLRERLDEKNKKEGLSKSKKSDSLIEKRKSLNNNISINVYINNAKISTPTKRSKKSSSKLQK